MERSPEEQAQTDRLENSYLNLQLDVMLSIERSVCGCDYGGNSWTSCEDAQRMETMLGLRSGLRLLDVGAGSGWPGSPHTSFVAKYELIDNGESH